MSRNRNNTIPVTLALVAGVAMPIGAEEKATDPAAASVTSVEPKAGESSIDREQERQARRLFDKAQESMEIKDYDAGIKALQKVIELFPSSKVRFEVYMVLAKHFLGAGKDSEKALNFLKPIRLLESQREKLTTELLSLYLESIYLTGTTYYERGDYKQTFATLRKIIANYPNSVWANQAYYYMGMSHFQMENWSKAIEYLNLVGTFIDPNSEQAKFIEAGQRVYVKVTDADLPILLKLQQEAKFQVEASSGDKVTKVLVPLSTRENMYIGSVPTQIYTKIDNDDVLQLRGGDKVIARYFDQNTEEGLRDEVRIAQVETVSTGSVAFTLATYEGKAKQAFLDTNICVVVKDGDLDISDQADKAEVKVISRYMMDAVSGVRITEASAESNKEATEFKWIIRDEVTLELTEKAGDGQVVHTGVFEGSVPLTKADIDAEPNRTDKILQAIPGDQLVVTYLDNQHFAGNFIRPVSCTIPVKPGGYVRSDWEGNRIPEHTLRARAKVLEATIALAIAKIFNSLGLEDGAKAKVNEGIKACDEVVILKDIPPEQQQEAIRLSWELCVEVKDLNRAMQYCQIFLKQFPESNYADDAMVAIGKIQYQEGQFGASYATFQQVMKLNNADAKAEACYMMAKSKIAGAKAAASLNAVAPIDEDKLTECAIVELRTTAELYPDSPFAGKALFQLVKYYIMSNDYATANEMLEQILVDHADQDWIPDMLALAVQLYYGMGNYERAYAKGQQVLMDYPSSEVCAQVRDWLNKQIIPALEAAKKSGADTSGGKDAKSEGVKDDKAAGADKATETK